MNEFLIELQAKLDEAKSKGNINEDILTIAKAIDSLKVQAEIDPNSVKNIANQLSKIMNQKIVVDNIQIDTKQFENASAKIGKSIGASINNNVSSSINSIKHDIDSVMNEFKQNKLTGYDLSKMFNLNRSDVDSSVIQQVRNLTKELNSLAMEALKIDSDSAWEGIVNKLNSLSDVLNKFGLKRDTESFAESLDVADYFKNKKIFIGDKSEVLSNTGMGIRELNNQFRSLGITFTTVSEGAMKLDTIWSELFNISPNLEKLVSFGDQLNGIVQHLKIAKEALYGENNLQPLDNGEVTAFLADWMGKLDDTFRKISLLKDMEIDLQEIATQSSKESAGTIIKNEKKKQQAYEDTAKAHAKLKSEMDDIVQKGDFKTSFSSSESIDDIKEYFKSLSATVSVKEKLDKGTGNEGFIVSLKNAVGVVEELRYKYNELTDQFEYSGGSINDSGVIKQIDAISTKADSLQIKLDKLKSSYSESNSQNPIKNQDSISALSQQYSKVAEAIDNVRSADNTTFSSMVSNANKEISILESMIDSFRKAETVSIRMKGNDLASGISIIKNDLEKFKAEAKDFPQIAKTISELDIAIENVTDPSSLYKFVDQLRVARSELAKIKSETTTANRNEKVSINVSGLQSKIDDLRRISPEIDSFKAKIGNADVTVQTLYDDLRKINTQGDFLVINSKWRSFTDAAKAAGIAITEVEANSKKSIGWLGKLGDSFKGQIKSIGSNLLQTFSIASGFMFVSSKVKETISEMKNLDDILTEISKTSDLTSQELKDLGISAYDSASKYGKTASDYLTGIKSMSQSGFYGEQGEAMAEQSLLAQAAGDMSAELADKYILASNAAYKLNGNAEKINEILDGQNMVCNRNSVAMADMAAGISKAGTVASSYNVAVEDLTAMIGTMEAVTKSGGEEVGNSLKSILINLQNVSSDKITGTLKKANASMTEFVNGAEKLRNPMAILRDLAETFNQLDKDDPLRAEIITNVASKYHASKFSALLQNMDMLDKMLVDYSEGAGSAMEEAQKSANNLSGSINSLSNSWNELVNTFVNTDELKGAVNILDNLLQSVTSIVDKLGMSGTVGLGAGLFAGIKDIGIFKSVQPTENNGLDDTKVVTSIKARKIAQEELDVSMAKQAAQLEIDTAALQAYEAECAKGAVSTEKFASIMDGASAQAQAYAVQTKGAAGSAQAFTTGQKQMQEGLKATTNASKAATIAGKAFSTAFNMLAFAAIAKGIQMAVSLVDNWIHRVEKANEAMDEAVGEYESAKSNLENINTELTENEKLIDELSAKDKLTYAEKGQLKELKDITEELKVQKDIEERKAELAAKEAASKTVDSYKTQYGGYDNTEARLNEKSSYDIFPVPEGEDDVLGNVAAYIRANELLEQSEKDYQDALKRGDSNTEWLLEEKQRFVDMKEEYADTLDSSFVDLQEKRANLEEEYNRVIEKRDSDANSLTTAEKEAIETYEEINRLIEIVYKYTDPNTWKSMQIDNVFNTEGIEKTKDELVAMKKAGTLDESVLQSYPKLSAALEQNKVSASDLCNELDALATKEQEIKDSAPDSNKKLSFSKILSDADVDDYQKKLSSLESYLEKFKSGEFSPSDKNSLLIDFGIVADSAEEAAEKIQKRMDKVTNSIVTDLKEILNGDNISEATRKKIEALIQSLEDANREAQNISSVKLTHNALADVQSLSSGLDQLDKVYADILDKEDFDFSSVFSAGFKKEFGAYTDEYNKFVETVTSSPDDINACQEAFNNLASAYIHGSGVLDEVTESTKASCIAMLEQMGVSNAAAVVEQALAKNEEVRKYETEAVAAATSDMSGKTKDASEKLLTQANVSETARKALFELVAQQTIFANQDLGLREKINGINQLASAYMGAAKAKIFQEAFEKNEFLNNLYVRKGEKGLSVEELYQKTWDQVSDKVFPTIEVEPVEIKYTGGETTRDTAEKLAEDAKKARDDAKKSQEDIQKAQENLNKALEKTEQGFDGIDIQLNNLIDSASKAKDKIDDLLTFGAKKKQTQKAIEETVKAIEAEYKAIKKYSAYADTASGKAAEKASIEKAKEIAQAQAELNDAIANANTAVNTASTIASNTVSGAVNTSVGVVNDALQYVGKLPYVWGGASLTTGADCSGFVQQLYKKYGVNIAHFTGTQYADPNGQTIHSQSDLIPGDLVFFRGSQGPIGHVGLYIGGGQFVEEPGRNQTAKVSFLSSRSDFVGGKRYAGISGSTSSAYSSTTALPSTSSSTKSVDTMSIKELQKYQKIWTSIPEESKRLVREGSFDIESITDEGLKAGIESYQQWWEKVKACKDKVEELERTLRELYQTMAELPVQKRDKIVESIEARTPYYEAERENVDTPIVSKKKFKQTKKQEQKARKSVKKSLRTKKQKTASGLNKEEIKKLNSYMKSGKQIPDSLLNSISDSALFEKCREYNDAVYLHSQYAKTNITANGSIKKFNSITDKLINATQKKTVTYKKAYLDTSKLYSKSLRKMSNAGNKVQKALGAKDTGLTQKKADKVLSYIKSGKKIPTTLLAEIELYGKGDLSDICRAYNQSVIEKETTRKALRDAKLDFRIQKQEGAKQKREQKVEKRQNKADKLQDKIDKYNALAENEVRPVKKNKYLFKTYSLTKDYYNQLINIAKLESNLAEADKLRTEKKKALLDIEIQELQNYSDTAAAKQERNNALAENEVTAEGKIKYLKKNAEQIRIEYAYLIKAAQLRKDSVEVTRLQAEMQKKLNDERKEEFQLLADENSAKMDYWKLKEENATDPASKNKFEAQYRNELVDYYGNQRQAAFNDTQEQLRLDEEYQQKMAESYKTEFDNISKYYSNLVSLISNDIADIDNEVKKIESAGRKVDASFYQSKIAFEEKNLAYYTQEEAELKDQLTNIRKGTNEWYECQDALQGVQDAQAESLSTIKEYRDAINEIADTIQEDILKGFHDITEEADLLITLLGDNFTDDKEGIITDDGLAALSLYVTQLNVCKNAVDDLRNEIDIMQEAVDRNQLSFIDHNGQLREFASIDQIKDKIKDLYSTYRDEVKHVYDYESNIINLMKEKYQAESDWLKDLIDKKRESLGLEKDLYEYSKNIKKQTDNIDSLRKQIIALKGDTSKEGEARSQKLQAQLKDAQDGLKDTEYDRYISDQQNMLDNMYNEHSALLTDLENDTDKLLQEGLELFAQTGSDVQDTIRDAADEYNYVITGNTGQVMSAIENLGSMETYLGAGGYVTNALNDIITEIKNVYTAIPTSLNNGDDSVKTGKNEEYDNQKPTATAPSTDLPPTEPTKPELNNLTYDKYSSLVKDVSSVTGNVGGGVIGSALAKNYAITNLINHGTGTYSATKSSDLNQYIYGKYKKALTQAEMSELSKFLGLNYTTKQLTSDKNRSKYKTNILKALQSIGLSKGGVVSKGKKLEDYGLKNTSGGTDKIPVVLTAGERVLTPVQNTMWEKWTANMPKLMDIAPKIDAVSKMPEVKTNNIASSVKVDYGNVNINLPNVKNYPDFMKCAQKDPNFNRMIDYMVDNHLKGFGSMGKYNVRF